MLRRTTSIVGRLLKPRGSKGSVLSSPLPRLLMSSGFSTKEESPKQAVELPTNPSISALEAEIFKDLGDEVDDELRQAVREILSSEDMEDEEESHEGSSRRVRQREPEYMVRGDAEATVPVLKVPFVPDSMRIEMYVQHMIAPHVFTPENIAREYGLSVDRIKAIIVLMHKRYEMIKGKGYEVLLHPAVGRISVIIPEPWVLLYGKYLEDPTRDIAETLRLYNEQINSMDESDFEVEELTAEDLEKFDDVDVDDDEEEDLEAVDEETEYVRPTKSSQLSVETTEDTNAEKSVAQEGDAAESNVETVFAPIFRKLSGEDKLLLESLEVNVADFEREEPKALTKAQFKLNITPEQAKAIIDDIIDHERRLENLEVTQGVIGEDLEQMQTEGDIKVVMQETANEVVLNGKKSLEDSYFPQLLSDEAFEDFKQHLLKRIAKETQAQVNHDFEHYQQKFIATAGQKLGKSTSPEAVSRWKLAFRDTSASKEPLTVIRNRQGELRTATPLEEQASSWNQHPTFLDEEFVKVTKYNRERTFGKFGDFDNDNHLTEELRLKKLEKTKAQTPKKK